MHLPVALFAFLANFFAFLDLIPPAAEALKHQKLKPAAQCVQKMSNQCQAAWSGRL
jgi:hypothetical protein